MTSVPQSFLREVRGAEPGAAGRHDRALALRVIWLGWTVVVLADRAKRGNVDDPWTLLLLPAGFVALAWPSSALGILSLAAAQVAGFVWLYADRTMVHWGITFILNSSVLLAWALHFLWRRREPSPATLYDWLAPSALLLCVVGVFFAGFAKLNKDFLDPVVSCGALYYLWFREHWFLAFLPDGVWAQTAAIWGAVTCEVAGPVLLLWRRTRWLGLVLTWLVFFGLVLNPRSHYFEFAGLFFVASLFFLDPEVLAELYRKCRRGLARVRARLWVRRVGARWYRPLRGTLPVWAALLFVSFVGTAAVHRGLNRDLLEVYRFVCAGGFLVIVGWVTWSAYRGRSVIGRLRPLFARRPWLAWLGLTPVAFMTLLQVGVYLGITHRPALTMASNFHGFPAANNHLVVNPMPTLGWGADVEIVESSVRGWRRGKHMSWLRFVEIMSRRPDASTSFRVNGGEVQHVERAGDERRFRSRPWLSYLVNLREYGSNLRPQYCPKALPGKSRRETRRIMRERLKEREAAAQGAAPTR